MQCQFFILQAINLFLCNFGASSKVITEYIRDILEISWKITHSNLPHFLKTTFLRSSQYIFLIGIQEMVCMIQRECAICEDCPKIGLVDYISRTFLILSLLQLTTNDSLLMRSIIDKSQYDGFDLIKILQNVMWMIS